MLLRIPGIFKICVLPVFAIGAANALEVSYDVAQPPRGNARTPYLTASGAAEQEGLGHLLRSGDLNGDHLQDLIVADGKGDVRIWFGRENLPPRLDVAGSKGPPPDVTLLGKANVHAMEVGDINGDGRDDLVLATINTTLEHSTNAVSVVLGRSNFNAALDIAVRNDSTGANTIISGLNDGHHWRNTGGLTLGDVNGDQRLDILIASWQADGYSSGRAGAGQVYGIFGRQNFSGLRDVNVNADFVIEGARAGDELGFGGAMKAADLNGDGRDEIILGAHHADGFQDQRANAGEAYIIMGRASPFPGQIDLSLPGHHGTLVTLYGADAGDLMTTGKLPGDGSVFETGDVNGDGLADLLIPAIKGDGPQNSREDAGEVYVVFGRTEFPPALHMGQTGDSGPNLTLWGADAGDLTTLGSALKAGDVNGDRVDDIILGSSEKSYLHNGQGRKGIAYVVLGRRQPNLFPATLDLGVQGSAGHSTKIVAGSHLDQLTLGGRILLADLDGNGSQDIVLGAPGAIAQSVATGYGRTYVLEGRPTFPAVLDLVGPPDNSRSVIHGASSGSGAETSPRMMAADLDGDGGLDLFLGEPLADGPSHNLPGAGEVYMIKGEAQAEITFLVADHQVITPEAEIPFGEVGLQGVRTLSMTIRNDGRRILHLGSIHLSPFEVDNPALNRTFEIDHSDFDSHLESGESTTLQIRFNPLTLGGHKWRFAVQSSDPDEPLTVLFFKGTGIKATPALAKALPATQIGTNQAVLRGTVDTKGKAQQVYFDYSTSPSGAWIPVLGPALSADHPAQQVIEKTIHAFSGNTRYYFRIRSQGEGGISESARLSFVTLNNAPLITMDPYEVHAVSGTVLRIPANNVVGYDPDGDALTVHSVTQPVLGGRVVKEKEAAVFHAGANFSAQEEPAVFSFDVQDGHGGRSTAQVKVFPGTVSFISDPHTAASEGETYALELNFTPVLTEWSVEEKLPWVSAVKITHLSPPKVEINIAPNPSINPRSGQMIIAGTPYHITQEGVSKPSIEMPVGGNPSIAIVGGQYEFAIVTHDGPVKYRVTGLPPGLAMDQSTGIIHGRPLKAGHYEIAITAGNAAGNADEKLEFDMDVAALEITLPGTYHGTIENFEVGGDVAGARVELTVTSTGAISGKILNPGKTSPLRGQMDIDPSYPTHPTFEITFLLRNGQEATISGTFDSETQTLAGYASDSAYTNIFAAWRNGWKSIVTPATAYAGKYSFRLRGQTVGEFAPQGDGFGSFAVDGKTGNLTVSGRLADGSVYTTRTFIGQQGQVLLYQPLYRNQGAFSGMLSVTADADPALNSITTPGTLKPSWHKNPLSDRNYPSGFDAYEQSVDGGICPTVDAGGVIMNLPDNGQATLSFIDVSGDRGLAAEFSQTYHFTNPSSKGKTNKAIPETPVSNAVVLTSLNALTGAFGGSFTLKTDVASETRKVPFQGQLVRIGLGIQGYGYFLLPDLPNPTRSSIYSGQVLLAPPLP